MRVFLRSEEKKRDNLKLKEAKEQAADEEVTPAAEPNEAQSQPQAEAASQPAVPATQGEAQANDASVPNVDAAKGEDGPDGALDGIPQVCFVLCPGNA